jgi:hypothetical protein
MICKTLHRKTKDLTTRTPLIPARKGGGMSSCAPLLTTEE